MKINKATGMEYSYLSKPLTLTVKRKDLATPAITIRKIEEDDYILGRIPGLDISLYDQYKMVVYVKTDKWHVHPFERGGGGLSFARIREDGTWSIQTVKKKSLAPKISAFLVRKDYSPPTTYYSTKAIDSMAKCMEDGKGRL